MEKLKEAMKKLELNHCDFKPCAFEEFDEDVTKQIKPSAYIKTGGTTE